MELLTPDRDGSEATREARIAASYAPGRSIIDWAIPVVYARDAGGTLVE